MIKAHKLEIEGKYPNKIKITYERFRVNIIHNSEKLKTLPLRSETRRGYPHSPLIFLARTIRATKTKI